MFYTYVLKSLSNGQWYIGSTRDLRKRFSQHNNGQSTWTKRGIPWEIIYYEACLDEEDARAREKYLKSGYGRKYLSNCLKRFLSTT